MPIINQQLLVNGVNFTNILSYIVSPTKVIINSYITQDGNSHHESLGWRDNINIMIGDIKKDELFTFINALSDEPVVTYFSPVLNDYKTVTCNLMNINDIYVKIWTSKLQYFSNFGITLEESEVYQL